MTKDEIEVFDYMVENDHFPTEATLATFVCHDKIMCDKCGVLELCCNLDITRFDMNDPHIQENWPELLI